MIRARLTSAGGVALCVGSTERDDCVKGSLPGDDAAGPEGPRSGTPPRDGGTTGDEAGAGVRCVSCRLLVAVGGIGSSTSSPIRSPSSGPIVGTSGRCRRQSSQPSKCLRICSASVAESRPSTNASRTEWSGQLSDVGAVKAVPRRSMESPWPCGRCPGFYKTIRVAGGDCSGRRCGKTDSNGSHAVIASLLWAERCYARRTELAAQRGEATHGRIPPKRRSITPSHEEGAKRRACARARSCEPTDDIGRHTVDCRRQHAAATASKRAMPLNGWHHRRILPNCLRSNPATARARGSLRFPFKSTCAR